VTALETNIDLVNFASGAYAIRPILLESQFKPEILMLNKFAIPFAVSAAFLFSAGVPALADASSMSFFVTSSGKGEGANLGGLEGADAHCAALAKAAGSGKTNWKAYLSTTAPQGEAGVNARDRIGKGPWQNVKGEVIASSVDELHSDKNNLTKETALSETGETVKGRGDEPNEHDVLTGSDPMGMYSTAGGDTTCKNWTSNDEGSAIVGHHDRMGLKDTRHMTSWNSSHGTPGCSNDALKKTGGNGHLYCFAAD
jgi:hypothetical protein